MGHVISLIGSLMLSLFIFLGACVAFLASSRERGSLAWAWLVSALVLFVTAACIFYTAVKA